MFCPELLAAIVVLLTFFPQRLLTMLWPWYSQTLGRAAYALAALFVPNLICVAGPIPTLAGPKLDVAIMYECSGIDGVCLFQALFALVAAVDWRSLNKSRVLIAYFAGITTMLVANFLRISLLAILGNRGLTTWIVRQHGNFGWTVFTLTFLAFLWISYEWMLSTETVPNGHDCH